MKTKVKQSGFVVLSGLLLLSVAGVGSYALAQDTSDDPAAVVEHSGGSKRLTDTAVVLELSADELKEQLEVSTIEEIVAESDEFETFEDFEAAIEDQIRERLAAKGLSDEEIEEKLARKAEKREIKEDVRSVRETLLGLTKDEIKELKREEGLTYEEIVQAAGFDDVDALHAAIMEAVAALWTAEEVEQETIDSRLEWVDQKFENRGEKDKSHKKDRFNNDSDD